MDTDALVKYYERYTKAEIAEAYQLETQRVHKLLDIINKLQLENANLRYELKLRDVG